ncbi:MAG: radical SAM family heme chaperone HemW, partial [Candidatus Binatia bacterium]|nr:radical SAM family heme chaperone HemW [Candidatus Binatia bacterium]
MGRNREPFSLYVHIPYCISKCPYCDFNSHVVPVIPEARYVEALKRELEIYANRGDWREKDLRSLFLGGGTPSTFSPESIKGILETAKSLFPFERECEITLEANPGTADSQNFAGYRGAGVNRINIGAQSFQSHILKYLGRVHSADETREALKIVHRSGFDNFNVDLIYAVPVQSPSDLQADLAEALSFAPTHLSAYNLTFEEGTPFHREVLAGRIRSLTDETEISMAELIEDTLCKAGLERYEISNYARPGLHSSHNVNYWQGGDYLGIGAGAHSYRRVAKDGILGHRWHNEKNPARYMERVEGEGRAVAENEMIDAGKAAGEFMFLGLRMTRGICTEEFSRRFGKSPGELYPQIREWSEKGLME